MPILENLGKIMRFTCEGRMGVHEANKCEDANIFLHSFLERRKTGEDFSPPNPNYKAKGDQLCVLGLICMY